MKYTATLTSSTGLGGSDGPAVRDDATIPPALIDVVELTEAEYQSLQYKSVNTIYIIVA